MSRMIYEREDKGSQSSAQKYPPVKQMISFTDGDLDLGGGHKISITNGMVVLVSKKEYQEGQSKIPSHTARFQGSDSVFVIPTSVLNKFFRAPRSDAELDSSRRNNRETPSHEMQVAKRFRMGGRRGDEEIGDEVGKKSTQKEQFMIDAGVQLLEHIDTIDDEQELHEFMLNLSENELYCIDFVTNLIEQQQQEDEYQQLAEDILSLSEEEFDQLVENADDTSLDIIEMIVEAKKKIINNPSLFDKPSDNKPTLSGLKSKIDSAQNELDAAHAAHQEASAAHAANPSPKSSEQLANASLRRDQATAVHTDAHNQFRNLVKQTRATPLLGAPSAQPKMSWNRRRLQSMKSASEPARSTVYRQTGPSFETPSVEPGSKTRVFPATAAKLTSRDRKGPRATKLPVDISTLNKFVSRKPPLDDKTDSEKLDDINQLIKGRSGVRFDDARKSTRRLKNLETVQRDIDEPIVAPTANITWSRHQADDSKEPPSRHENLSTHLSYHKAVEDHFANMLQKHHPSYHPETVEAAKKLENVRQELHNKHVAPYVDARNKFIKQKNELEIKSKYDKHPERLKKIKEAGELKDKKQAEQIKNQASLDYPTFHEVSLAHDATQKAQKAHDVAIAGGDQNEIKNAKNELRTIKSKHDKMRENYLNNQPEPLKVMQQKINDLSRVAVNNKANIEKDSGYLSALDSYNKKLKSVEKDPNRNMNHPNLIGASKALTVSKSNLEDAYNKQVDSLANLKAIQGQALGTAVLQHKKASASGDDKQKKIANSNLKKQQKAYDEFSTNSKYENIKLNNIFHNHLKFDYDHTNPEQGKYHLKALGLPHEDPHTDDSSEPSRTFDFDKKAASKLVKSKSIKGFVGPKGESDPNVVSRSTAAPEKSESHKLRIKIGNTRRTIANLEKQGKDATELKTKLQQLEADRKKYKIDPTHTHLTPTGEIDTALTLASQKGGEKAVKTVIRGRAKAEQAEREAAAQTRKRSRAEEIDRPSPRKNLKDSYIYSGETVMENYDYVNAAINKDAINFAEIVRNSLDRKASETIDAFAGEISNTMAKDDEQLESEYAVEEQLENLENYIDSLTEEQYNDYYENLSEQEMQTVNQLLDERAKYGTKAGRRRLAKKIRAGKDIGKKGKNFEKIADEAAERYGSEEAGRRVAAAAMWKSHGG